MAKAALFKLASAGPAAIRPLEKALAHPSPAVRDLAAEILQDLRETGG